MKYLYKLAKDSVNFENFENLDVEIVPPLKFSYKISPQGEHKSFKLLAVRCLFHFITLGKAKVYCYRYNGEPVHTSYVIPKCYKFPFMSKYDYEIGPCFTYPNYRGKGIYPAVLRYICQNIGTEKTTFYMVVDEYNQSSIRGIEKAGFVKCGKVRTTKVIKKYILE